MSGGEGDNRGLTPRAIEEVFGLAARSKGNLQVRAAALDTTRSLAAGTMSGYLCPGVRGLRGLDRGTVADPEGLSLTKGGERVSAVSSWVMDPTGVRGESTGDVLRSGPSGRTLGRLPRPGSLSLPVHPEPEPRGEEGRERVYRS